MRVVAVIPARLASTRLPGKVLREIAGRPMLAWVYEAARSSPLPAEVIVATDADEVLALCRRQGWRAMPTSAQHASGTDRVREVSQSVSADVYLNLQADEPLARPEHIAALLAPFSQNRRGAAIQVSTLRTPCAAGEVGNPNAVKVVADAAGRALYFSRAPIPYPRQGTPAYYKHLGFYAYRKAALDRFGSLPQSELERSERLEQLRFLENGIPIQVVDTPYDTIGVDTEEDLERAAAWLRGR